MRLSLVMIYLLFSVSGSGSLNQELLHLDILKIRNNIPFTFQLNLNDNVTENDVIYYLFSRKHQNITINRALGHVNRKLPTKVLIHGWTEHVDVEWYNNTKRAYLNRGHYNVILVDWSSKGDQDYLSASRNTKAVGDQIGDFLIKLHEKIGVPYKNMHLISHSLGCHVAGYAGKRVFGRTKLKLARITGLDPAAPIFDLFTFNQNDRLWKDDAHFVDALHTDGGSLGFSFSIGTADFYPNGGFAVQPGCSLVKADLKYEDLFCSHASSHQLFIKSINTRKFLARSCDTWEKYSAGLCNATAYVIFGEDVSPKASGNFFFRTAEKDLRL